MNTLKPRVTPKAPKRMKANILAEIARRKRILIIRRVIAAAAVFIAGIGTVALWPAKNDGQQHELVAMNCQKSYSSSDSVVPVTLVSPHAILHEKGTPVSKSHKISSVVHKPVVSAIPEKEKLPTGSEKQITPQTQPVKQQVVCAEPQQPIGENIEIQDELALARLSMAVNEEITLTRARLNRALQPCRSPRPYSHTSSPSYKPCISIKN